MQPVQLTITMEADGRIGVSGPIDNLVLCLGLLELAKDALRNHAQQKTAGPKILVPTPRLVGAGNGRG